MLGTDEGDGREEATCGKFKAHHVKNYSTTHYTRRRSFSFFLPSSSIGSKITVSQHFTAMVLVKRGRKAESYLMSNKRISTINKVCSGDLKLETGKRPKEKHFAMLAEFLDRNDFEFKAISVNLFS